MKKTKWVLAIIGFIVLLLICSILYQNLREDYTNQQAKKTNVEENIQEGNTNKKQAKNFTIYDEQGNALHLSDFAGKGIVINVWTTWCGYCKEEMPYFDKLYQENKDNVHFLMVNVLDGGTESVENGIAYRDGQGYSFPIYFDKEFNLIYSYQLTGYPNTIFIDKDGNLEDIHYGLITEEQLKEGIEKIK